MVIFTLIITLLNYFNLISIQPRCSQSIYFPISRKYCCQNQIYCLPVPRFCVCSLPVRDRIQIFHNSSFWPFRWMSILEVQANSGPWPLKLFPSLSLIFRLCRHWCLHQLPKLYKSFFPSVLCKLPFHVYAFRTSTMITQGMGKITQSALSIKKFDLSDFLTLRYSPPLVTWNKNSQETQSGKTWLKFKYAL